MSPFESLYGRKCNMPVSLGYTNRPCSSWARFSLGNGGEDGKDKEELKGFQI
jgi:hypothetical protein